VIFRSVVWYMAKDNPKTLKPLLFLLKTSLLRKARNRIRHLVLEQGPVATRLGRVLDQGPVATRGLVSKSEDVRHWEIDLFKQHIMVLFATVNVMLWFIICEYYRVMWLMWCNDSTLKWHYNTIKLVCERWCHWERFGGPSRASLMFYFCCNIKIKSYILPTLSCLSWINVCSLLNANNELNAQRGFILINESINNGGEHHLY